MADARGKHQLTAFSKLVEWLSIGETQLSDFTAKLRRYQRVELHSSAESFLLCRKNDKCVLVVSGVILIHTLGSVCASRCAASPVQALKLLVWLISSARIEKCDGSNSVAFGSLRFST